MPCRKPGARALQNLERVDPAHLRGWLFTVAYHEAMLLKRRQKSRQGTVDGQELVPDAAPGPLLQAEQREELLRLRQLLERLPAAQREVIRQRIYEGKRFRDIAEELHCPLNTALARMHEGLKRLRCSMEPIMPDHQSAPDADQLLAVQALLYAGDALPVAEAQAFEWLLSQDQKAREALGLAAQVVHTGDPDAEVLPNPTYRRRLQQQFALRPGLWTWLCRRRSYPGHPAVWSGLGAAVAALLLIALVRGFWTPPLPTPPPGPATLPVQEAQAPAGVELHESLTKSGNDLEEALIWVELSHSDHLRKTHFEEVQHRHRSERLSRLEGTRGARRSQVNKH